MHSVLKILLILLLFGSFHGQAQAERKIDGYLKKVFHDHTIPGFAAVVVRDGEIIYKSGFGKKSLAKNADFTARTVSDIGSLTKSITAMAMMQLVEQNKVSLDTPLVRYLPDFRTANKEMSDKVTVRMLLGNTAGLKSNPIPSFHPSTEALEYLLKNLKTTFLSREPGSSYEYSNTDFSIAGLLIHRLTGMSYEAYVEENIFAPLRMSSSISNALTLDRPYSLNGHHYGLQPLPSKSRGFIKSGEYVPAGSATQSTVEDLGNYLVALLNWGSFEGKQILAKESVEELWHPNISFQGLSEADGGNGKDYQYGLGWMISEIDGRRVIHHGGSTGTMSSFTMIDLENKTATSLLFNIDLTFIDKHQFVPHYTIANNILHLASGESISDFGTPKREDNTKNEFELIPEEMKKYIGKYQYEGGGLPWIDFGLILDVNITREQKLLTTASNRGEIVGEYYLDFVTPSVCVTRNIAQPENIRFDFSPKGKIKGLIWNGRIYKKKNEKVDKNLRTYTLFGQERVVIPKNWTFEKTPWGFTASNPNNGSKITGWLGSGTTNKEKFDLEKYLSGYRITEKGIRTKQNLSIHTWEMQSLQSRKGTILTIFSQPRFEPKTHIILESKVFDHTKNINDVIKPLLTFLTFNSI